MMAVCRHCAKPLLPENQGIADCCPCNSGRGINHGLVPTACCTCEECDPVQTGSSRVTVCFTCKRQNFREANTLVLRERPVAMTAFEEAQEQALKDYRARQRERGAVLRPHLVAGVTPRELAYVLRWCRAHKESSWRLYVHDTNPFRFPIPV